MGFRLQLTEPRVKELSTVLSKLIEDALSDRRQIEREWTDCDELYNNKIDMAKTNFPWPGASSFSVPLGETYTNAISGRMTDSIHGPEPTYTVRNRTSQWVEAARATSDWLQYLVSDVIHLRQISERFNFLLAKYGTAFMYAPYEVLLDKRLRYNVEADDVEQTVDQVMAGPMVEVPQMHDILVPKETVSTLISPWIAQRFRRTDDELMVRAFSGVYNQAAVEKALKFPSATPDELTRRKASDQGFSPSAYAPFHEIWQWMGLFKLPGMKFATWIIVPFHMGSKQPLALLVNFYPNQFRPYFAANFQPTEAGIYGRGICKMVRSGNLEVNDMHKHRVDNAMVANTRFYKVKSGWFAQLPKAFKIWPGRMVPVNNADDITGEAMADIYNSTINEELLTRRTLEQLVGLSDFSLSSGGGEGLKRVGATAALTAVQESGRVLNSRLNHVRETYGQLGAWLVNMTGHFRPVDEMQQVLGPKGTQAMLEMFEAPQAAVRGNVGIELTASSATMNREMEKQSDILLVNIMSTYLSRFMELGTLIANPEAPQPLKDLGIKVANIINELMRDVLRDFNKRNSALILSEFEDVITGGGRQGDPQAQRGLPGVGPAGQGTEADLAGAAAGREGLAGEVNSLGSLLRVGGRS